MPDSVPRGSISDATMRLALELIFKTLADHNSQLLQLRERDTRVTNVLRHHNAQLCRSVVRLQDNFYQLRQVRKQLRLLQNRLRDVETSLVQRRTNNTVTPVDTDPQGALPREAREARQGQPTLVLGSGFNLYGSEGPPPHYTLRQPRNLRRQAEQHHTLFSAHAGGRHPIHLPGVSCASTTMCYIRQSLTVSSVA